MDDARGKAPSTRNARRRDDPPAVKPKVVNLALQGGGAHGAFAWGVLDRLLEDERISIDGISAASAGAMNAVVLAHGMTTGGREGAREALATFWRRVADAGTMTPFQPSPIDRWMENHRLDHTPAYIMFDLVTRLLSPYQFNPLNYNPLLSIVEQTVDFERLRACPSTHLYLTATNVRTGKVRVFTTPEITSQVVMASACLPLVFQAVEIEGEAYWDGGFMGNPAIFPLIYDNRSRDVVVVHVNPLTRDEVPRTASDILNRINEISFNSSLMREMRAIAFVSRLIDDGRIQEGSMKRMLIHSIAADDVMSSLGVASKLNTDWGFLCHLRDVGRERAQAWTTASYDHIGLHSTADLDAYL